MTLVDPVLNSSPAALGHHSRFTNSAAYAIINIGEFQWQNIIQPRPTELTEA